jgi:hypothetical protein
MLVSNEVGHAQHHISLSFVDFLEALVRSAEMRCKPKRTSPLHVKTECLIRDLLHNLDQILGDGDGDISLQDFQKFKTAMVDRGKASQSRVEL